MRKPCRHCKMTLPTPTSNEREAFCTRGCYNSFYLHRCRVCEKPIEQKSGQQRFVCKRAKCRNAWKGHEGFGKYAKVDSASSPSKNASIAQETLILSGSASTSGAVDRANTAYAPRPWRMVAGRLTSNQYHCAVVGDAPDPNGGLPDIPYARVWADGDWQGTENRNRKLLEKHLARAADKAPARAASSIAIDAKRVAALVATIPADLSIPPFLDRRPPPALKEAA
jgi:hypothetical protein